MTMLTSLGRALAVDRGKAQRITTVRHVHVSDRPMVFIPLKMAGESWAPVAAMVGTDRKNPELLVVAQPRNRAQRFAFAHSLARILMREITTIESWRCPVPGKPPGTVRCADALQIWVPNRAGIDFVRMLGRSTRFRKTTGQWAVPANVPRMGKWLTFYANRAEHAGSSLLVAATAALSQHWATGQSGEEDEHLATLLAWIEPGVGVTGAEAARAVEDPIKHPPAGPATDPTFDNEVLEPLIHRYDANPHDMAERDRAEAAIKRELRRQLEGTWERMWRAIDLLKLITPGNHVSERWDGDLESFTRTADWIATSRATYPKRDAAVTAARRLYDLERDRATYEAQRAFDDPLVMAEARLAGEAFVGTVTDVERDRRVDGRKAPRIVVETTDPVHLTTGDSGLRSPARRLQDAEVLSVTESGGRVSVELELTKGMGNRREPDPGTVPELGEEVCYSLFIIASRPAPRFPERVDTPWTHGGPPPDYEPTAADAQEEWQ